MDEYTCVSGRVADCVIPYGKWCPVAVRWGSINSYTGPLTFSLINADDKMYQLSWMQANPFIHSTFNSVQISRWASLKTGWWSYPMVKTSWSCLDLFSHNTSMWETDRQMEVLSCSALKTKLNLLFTFSEWILSCINYQCFSFWVPAKLELISNKH